MPKQFIEFNGKPIQAYTVDIFYADKNIDAIEIVCHHDWMNYVKDMVKKYEQTMVRWITNGGETFQNSTVNGVLNLKDKASKDDIVVISFGVAPMTPQADIVDSIRVCRGHGNGIASQDIALCTWYYWKNEK